MKNILFLFLSVIIISSCEEKEESCPIPEQPQLDKEIIQKYISDNNIEAMIEDESGLFYKIIQEGNGNHPNISSEVTVKYKGTFIDGKVFDETGENPTSFPLSNLIEGWKIGIPKLKPFGKGLFIVPSSLGYGCEDHGTIPGNSVLVFEIELVTFEN